MHGLPTSVHAAGFIRLTQQRFPTHPEANRNRDRHDQRREAHYITFLWCDAAMQATKNSSAQLLYKVRVEE